jgi:hypothetical protein
MPRLTALILILFNGCSSGGTVLCETRGCPADQVCTSEGSCEAVVCTRHQCLDLHTAAICGGRLRLEERSCAEHELCLNARCQLAACQPGQSRCAPSGMRERCLDNGQGYFEVPCGEGTGCHEGACLPLSCTRDDNSCLDTETLLACNQTGTALVRQVCVAATCRALQRRWNGLEH